MKVLFVGLGSIGQRHLRNLRQLKGDKVDIRALRASHHTDYIQDGTAKSGVLLHELYQFSTVTDLDLALRDKPDIVFITNPTSLHMQVALKAAARGCHLFIEKPLSHSDDDVDELARLVAAKGLVAMVGFQSRYHPIVKDIKQRIEDPAFGNVISAHLEWGTFMPNHHPYEDYRVGYAANQSLGGGVTLGLSHDIDLMHHFFGFPQQVFALGGKLSRLEMDTDDTLTALLGYARPHGVVPVSLCLSYAQTKELRRYRIQFDRCTLLGDMVANDLQLFGSSGTLIDRKSYPDLDRNDLFIEELRDFLQAVERRGQPTISFQSILESHRLVMWIKKTYDNLAER